MPEILTKHPEIVIELLQKEGIKCSRGAEQKILTKCPAESFCTLKAGELCVYGVDQFQQMTQIKPEDLGLQATTTLNAGISNGTAFVAGFLACLLLFRLIKKL